MKPEEAASLAAKQTRASRFALLRGHVHRVRARDVDVVATRERLGLSQAEFATAFGVSVSTVRNWEQGRRTPEGPAVVLLTVIEKAPRTVLRAIWTGPMKRKAAA